MVFDFLAKKMMTLQLKKRIQKYVEERSRCNATQVEIVEIQQASKSEKKLNSVCFSRLAIYFICFMLGSAFT